MKLVIDLSSRQPITDFGNNAPVPPYTVKSQDTAVVNVYFVQGGFVQDLGAGAVLKFGIVQAGMSTLLVLDTVFNRYTDSDGNVYYEGFPVFNTSALLTALGSSVSIMGSGEIRYQLPDGEITHCLDIPFVIYRTILQETSSTTTTANFTQPAIGANVPIAVVTTSFLSAGDVVSIGTNGDTYTVVSVTDGTHFVGENLGTGTTAPGGTIASGAIVTLAPPNVLATYPDVSTIELKVHKDQPSGYAGLSAAGTGYISNVHVLVDGSTITNSDPLGLATADKLTYLTAAFVQPAINATIAATVASSARLTLNQAVEIIGGGYYLITGISGTSITLKNNGDPYNVAAGTTIPAGAALRLAQATAAGGGGTAGVNAYTTLTSGFIAPAVGTSVTITVGNTAWIGGTGQVLFIQGAGYYAVSAVLSPTTVSITNLGYPGNAAPSTNISSGNIVSPGGLIGATGTGGVVGENAYDKTAASFVMPAAAANVSITIGSTAWLAAGQVIYIATAGYFSVASVSNPSTFQATNLNYPGNAGSGTTIAANSAVSPGGLIGATGSGGAGKNAFTTLTNNFIQPAVASTVSIVVGTTAWMAVGQAIFVQGGGYYTVTSITDLTNVVITNLGYSANAAVGATVSAAGGAVAVVPSGLSGAAGTSAFTTVTNSFIMPTNLTGVNVTVGSTAWMAPGMYVFLPTAGYFTVSTITDGTHVALTNLGTTGNAPAGTVIAAGTAITAAGAQGPAGSGGTGGGGAVTLNHTQAIRTTNWTYVDATVIPWTAVNWDTDSKWASANPSRLTVVTAGYYQVTVQLSWGGAGGSTTYIYVNVTVNGSTHPKLGNVALIVASSFTPTNQIISGILKLNAGDYVEVVPWLQSGTAPNALVYEAASASSPVGPFFQLDYLGT